MSKLFESGKLKNVYPLSLQRKEYIGISLHFCRGRDWTYVTEGLFCGKLGSNGRECVNCATLNLKKRTNKALIKIKLIRNQGCTARR